jgi:hypothetical protein
LPKARLLLPITSLSKPLVETSCRTSLSLLLVVPKAHSFEEGNCGGHISPLGEKAKLRKLHYASYDRASRRIG